MPNRVPRRNSTPKHSASRQACNSTAAAVMGAGSCPPRAWCEGTYKQGPLELAHVLGRHRVLGLDPPGRHHELDQRGGSVAPEGQLARLRGGTCGSGAAARRPQPQHGGHSHSHSRRRSGAGRGSAAAGRLVGSLTYGLAPAATFMGTAVKGGPRGDLPWNQPVLLEEVHLRRTQARAPARVGGCVSWCAAAVDVGVGGRGVYLP